MKTKKKFDSVKMMREIRSRINSEISEMTPDQILEYLKQGQKDFEKNLINQKQT